MLKNRSALLITSDVTIPKRHMILSQNEPHMKIDMKMITILRGSWQEEEKKISLYCVNPHCERKPIILKKKILIYKITAVQAT